MVDLSVDRISTEPPFMCVGLDMFGPFTVKHYREEMKQYGIIFTCISSGAVHFDWNSTGHGNIRKFSKH